MHKRIKNIIAVSLIISAISGVVPVSNLTLGFGSVKAYAWDDDDDDDLYDEAYLEGIYLSDGDIDFSKTDSEYDVNVGKDVDEITIKAKPQNDDDLVQINGDSVEDKDYKKIVKLDKGKNEITIYVETDDDHNTYTLNVYRGDSDTTTSDKSSTNTTKPLNTTDNTSTDSTKTATKKTEDFQISDGKIKYNAWNRVDGKWKYVDGTGQFLKNQWWFDKNTGINYYINEDGYRTTGWLHNNNNWYHFNDNGEMQTGWICINKNWYYLNKSGVMKMGWLEDSSGNWYYLDNDGSMKTGWIENSDGKWYYLDATGKMIKDSTVSGYKLASDGTLTNQN